MSLKYLLQLFLKDLCQGRLERGPQIGVGFTGEGYIVFRLMFAVNVTDKDSLFTSANV